jgi:hypothetical protein
MKKQIFSQCDKCIGITPCKELNDGSVVCEYCYDEVKRFDVKKSPSEADLSTREQSI